MRRFLRVVVDHHGVFFFLLARLGLLPTAQARREHEGHNRPNKPNRVGRI